MPRKMPHDYQTKSKAREEQQQQERGSCGKKFQRAHHQQGKERNSSGSTIANPSSEPYNKKKWQQIYIFILINISFIRINLWRASRRTNVKNKKIFEMGINEFQALSLSLSLTLFPFGCQYASLFFYSKMGVLEKEHLIRWQHNLKKPTVIFIVMFSIFFLSSNLSMY